MRGRLTPGQIEGLSQLSGGKLTPREAWNRVGPAYRRTLESLAARGLVLYFPHGRAGQGAWGLTQDGRARVRALLAAGVLRRAPWARET